MSAPGLSDESAAEAAEFLKQHGNVSAAARAANMPRATFMNRVLRAAERGMLLKQPGVMPGYRVSSVTTAPNGGQHVTQKKDHGEEFAVPTGHEIKGVSALVDADGRMVQQWVKTRIGQLDPLAIAEELKKAFEGYKPAAKPVKAPAATAENLLTLIPANDWHIGMFAWGKEVGANWDLKIAEDAIGKAVEDLIERSPASAEAIVLGGGDLLHADNKDNQTAHSGNKLDVDGRYQKVLTSACRLMVRTIDAALRRHKHVTVRVLPGNHDEHAAVAVAYFLLAWYRNEKRVTVDADPSLFFWFRFGAVMLGATHGHTVKLAQMPGVMAHRRAEDWGATKFRYVHGFHIHHSSKVATEGNGVICESHQAPIPQDAWHYGAGFLSGRSMQAITYHKKFGEIGRVRVAMLDGEA